MQGDARVAKLTYATRRANLTLGAAAEQTMSAAYAAAMFLAPHAKLRQAAKVE